MGAGRHDRHAGVPRRTVLAGALVGAGVLAGLTGCARGTLTRPAAEGTVTFNNDNPTWEPGYADASAVLASRIGLELAVRAIPNVSNYQQVVRMSAQTDSTTDLFKWWNGYRLRDIARSDLLADLSPVWDTAESRGWVDPSLRESFSFEGRAYGVPLYKSYFTAFYSKRAFEAIGAAPPDTFEDFRALCAELRDDGVTPIQAGGASSWESLMWFQQLVGGLSPDYYEAVTSHQAAYTDDVAQQAMQLWSQMYADGFFSAADADSSAVPNALQEGTVGLALAGTWSASSYGQAGVSADDVGVFLVPPPEPSVGSYAFVESGAIVVPVNAHKLEDAHRVAAAWLATDVQQAWVDFLGDTSANLDAVPGGSVVTEFAQQVTEIAPRQLVRYWEASPPILIEGNVQDLSAFMVTPTEANARATLTSMQARAEAEWTAWENS